MAALRAHLRLIRLPNGLTTIADVLAGACVATARGGRMPDTAAMALGAMATICLYGFGMALNDWVDRDKDRRLHPYRPIPSGEVTENAALALVWALPAAALVLCAGLGWVSFAVGVALIAAITWYDLAARSQGPLAAGWAMGSCRALSFGMGISLAFPDADPRLLRAAIIAALYGVAVLWILIISLLEEESEAEGARRGRTLIVLLGSAWAVPLIFGDWPWMLAALALLVVILIQIAEPLRRRPVIWGLVVRNAVFSLPLLASAICLSFGFWPQALAAAAVFPLVRLCAWAIAQRGS
jgi:4-hydroxybenzoate polyprenyltransferase